MGEVDSKFGVVQEKKSQSREKRTATASAALAGGVEAESVGGVALRDGARAHGWGR